MSGLTGVDGPRQSIASATSAAETGGAASAGPGADRPILSMLTRSEPISFAARSTIRSKGSPSGFSARSGNTICDQPSASGTRCCAPTRTLGKRSCRFEARRTSRKSPYAAGAERRNVSAPNRPVRPGCAMIQPP